MSRIVLVDDPYYITEVPRPDNSGAAHVVNRDHPPMRPVICNTRAEAESCIRKLLDSDG